MLPYLILVGIAVAALLVGLAPQSWRWPIAIVSLMGVAGYALHWWRFVVPRRRAARRSRPEPSFGAPTRDPNVPGAEGEPRIERIEDAGLQVTRVSFPLRVAVPMVLRVRRRAQPRPTELLVRNTGIEQSAFEFELLPILAGDEEFDRLVEMRSNQRIFVQGFLRHERYELFVEMFQSERWVLLELYCDGENLHFVLHPTLDELPPGSSQAFLRSAETFYEQFDQAVGDELERFFPST